MPSPNDSGCSGWNDALGKTGTWHIKIKKKRKKKPHSYHMNEMFGLFTPELAHMLIKFEKEKKKKKHLCSYLFNTCTFF